MVRWLCYIDYCIEVVFFVQKTWTEISEGTFSHKSSLRRYTEFIIRFVYELFLVYADIFPSTKVFCDSRSKYDS